MSHNAEGGKILNNSCFNLQFRRDVRHDRINEPTYYSWKAQFVLLEEIGLLKKINTLLGCGRIYENKNQARFVVQNIDNLHNIVVLFVKDYQLSGKRKNDFQLWAKAIGIIYKNKRKSLKKWKKEDLQKIIEIQKKMQGYKTKPKKSKWLSVAELIKNR